MSDTPELKVTEAVQELAKKVGKQVTIGEGGVVTLEKDFAENLLPEDLTMAQIKKTQEFRADLVAATTLALGEAAIPYLKKNKEENLVTTGFAYGKDSVDVSITRSKTYPAIREGSEPMTKYGVAAVKYTANGATNSRGSFKKVAAYLAETAAGKLGK